MLITKYNCVNKEDLSLGFFFSDVDDVSNDGDVDYASNDGEVVDEDEDDEVKPEVEYEDGEEKFDIEELDDKKNGSDSGKAPRRPTSALCIPNDSLADIDFFPMFTDDLISLSGVLDIDEDYFEGTPSYYGDDDSLLMSSDQVIPGNKRKRVSIGGKQKRKNRRPNKYWSLNSSVSLCGYGTRTDDRRIERQCTHCGTKQTPQWRVGPKGPKTLCNACGVRYKSGRLVPEYRPMAAPSFDERLHSNSHRKIMKMKTIEGDTGVVVEEPPMASPSSLSNLDSTSKTKVMKMKMKVIDGGAECFKIWAPFT